MKLRTHRFTAYFMAVFTAINSVWMTIYPTLSYANTVTLTTAEQAKLKDTMNKGQWDGALMIKKFEMPTLKKDDAPAGLDSTTGQYSSDPSHYNDSTKKHLKNEVYLQQLFPDYDQATFDQYVTDATSYVIDPELVQDGVAQIKDDVAFYKNIDCETLTDQAEKDKCDRSKIMSALDDMKNNDGKNLFSGANDSILQDTSDLLDGTHPYFDDLYNEECREIVREGDDGAAIIPSERRVCMVHGSSPSASCKAERYMETEYVDTKTVMSYTGDADYEILRSAMTTVTPCAGESDCLLIEMKPTTIWRDTIVTNDVPPTWSVYGVEMKFGPGVSISRAQLITLDTTTPPPTNPSLSIPGHVTTQIKTNEGSVYDDPGCSYWASGWDWSTQYMDNLAVHYKCAQIGQRYWENNEISTSAPLDLDVDKFKLNKDGVLNVAGIIIDSFADSLPFTHTGAPLENTQTVKIYLEQETITTGSPSLNTVVASTFIDDTEEYPKQSIINVIGEPIRVTVDVFDEDIYTVGKHVPTNFQITGDSVLSFKVLDHGRATNKWRYEVEIELSEIASFEVTADIHKILDQGIRPVEGEPYCQAVIDAFIESTYPGTASCNYSLGEVINEPQIDILGDTHPGIVFNENSLGYLNIMREWGENGEPPLERECWEAVIVVDPSSGVGISAEDKGLSCAGLEGEQYDNCMAGSWCSYDELNGQDVCYDTANGLQLGFGDACAGYIENPACTYAPTETTCEDWGEDESGNQVCLYESHIFNCEIETSGYGIPAPDETETVCGGPVQCMNGECTNIKKEGNESFAKAAAMQQVADEVKRNNNCTVDASNAGSCKLFGGDAGKCKQPHLWGAQDCCDPDAMGMGEMDIVAYWKMANYIESLSENEAGAGWLSQAWTGTSDYVLGSADAPTAMGSAFQSVTNSSSGAVNTLMDPIKTGFNSFAKSLGFDPLFESSVTAMERGATTAINAVTNSTSNLAASSAFSGVYQYIAQGVYDFIALFSDALAEALFQTAESAGGELIVQGWADELLGTLVGNLLSWLSTVMMIYSIYNLVVGLIYGCKQNDFQTAQKIKLLSSHYVGSYCSDKTIFGCAEHSQRHCLYGSPFSRIMAEQIRIQQAEDAGVSVQDIWLDPNGNKKKKEPLCEGFSLDDINQLDWDRVDLSEFLEIVMAKMKYDPNNMPGDFTPSEAGAGGRTGPQAGITSIESNIAALKSVGNANDTLRQNLTTHNMQMNNPEYMPFYERQPSSDATGCVMTCSAEFMYNSASGTCEKRESTEVIATKSCDSAGGYVFDSGQDLCVKEVVTSITSGCPQAFTLNLTTGMCEGIAYSQLPADISCELGFSYNSTTNKCEKKETIDTVSNCSVHGDGWILQDGLCVLSLTQSVPPIKKCPTSDYTITGQVCTYTANLPYTVICQPGEIFDLVTGQCQIVSEIKHAVNKSCPSGFVLENDSCIKTETGGATLVCDSSDGWALEGNRCIKTTTVEAPANQGCPIGYSVTDDYTQCEKYDLSTSESPECESGWTLSTTSGFCYKDVSESKPAEYICNLGFTYSSVDSECKKVTKYPVAYGCDEANGYYFEVATSTCVNNSQDIIPAGLSCTPPSVLNNGMCETQATGGYHKECPAGYSYNSIVDQCWKYEKQYTDPVVTCPSDYEVKGLQCIQTVSVPASKICPSDTTLNVDTDKCEKILNIIESMTPTCPKGFRNEGDSCVGREVVDAAATCLTDGYQYDEYDKKCFIDEEDYVESLRLCPEDSPENVAGLCKSRVVKEPVYECPLGFHYSIPQATCVSQDGEYIDALETCEADWTYDIDLKVCTKTDTYVGITCETGFTYDSVSGQCVQQFTISATPYCADGYAFDGASCIKVEHSPLSCLVGYVYDPIDKVCKKDESQAATLVCEDGFTYDSVSGECINNDSLPPICPANHTYNATTDLCEMLSIVAPDKVCPANYYYDGTGCAKLETAPATCDTGLTYDPLTSLCSSSAYPLQNYCPIGVDSGIDCRIREQAIPTCMSGYFYNTNTQLCEMEETVDGTPYCQFSSAFSVVLLDERCAYYSTTSILDNGDCQESYSLSAGECIRYDEFTDPLYECPPDYTHVLDGNGIEIMISPTCVKLNQEFPVCDTADGFTFVGGFCEKYHAKPYQQRCLVAGSYRYGAACLSGDVDSLKCPSAFGYSKDNNRCEFIDFVAHTLSCDSSYVLDGSDCKTNITAPPTCEADHIFNPTTDSCEPIIMAPTCPAGYVYNATLDKCEFRQDIPADGSCPAGTFDNGSGCTAFHEARCISGYILDNAQDKCIKYEVITATSFCAPDEIPTASGCIKEHYPKCSTGYIYSESNNRCEQITTKPVTENCGTGYEDVGDGCLRVSTPTCRGGYTWIPANDRCEKFETLTYNTSCPSGEVDTGSGCQPQELPQCSAGYTYSTNSNQCEKYESKPADTGCPSGYTDTGSNCLRTANPTCGSGYSWVALNDRCEKFESTPLTEECPLGSDYKWGGCWRTQAPSCSAGFTFDPDSDLCVKEETQDASLTCDIGYFSSGSLCYAFESPSCESGFTYDSSLDKCKKRLSQPASGGCDTGSDNGSGCEVVDYKPFNCSSGTYNTTSNKCETVSQVNATQSCSLGDEDVGNGCKDARNPSCPTNYEYAGSFNCRMTVLLQVCSYKPWLCEDLPATCDTGFSNSGNTVCLSNTTFPYNLECPNGYSRSGSVCTKITQVEPTCESGYVKNFEDDRCEKVTTGGYEYSCPSGWDLVATTCYKWDYKSPNCSSGFSYHSANNRCEANIGIAPNASCSSGWTLVGQTCFRTSTELPSCSSSYGYNSQTNLCQMGVGFEYSCPTGWTTNISQNRCERTLTQAANCPVGTSYNSISNRCEGSSITYTYTCDVGWVVSGSSCERTLTDQPTCSSGFIFTPSIDMCVASTDPYIFSCPSGWTDNTSQNRCERTLVQVPDCVVGTNYDPIDNRCEGSKIGYTYSCASPWYLDGSICKRLLTEAPSCDRGYSYIAGDDICRTPNLGYDYECPTGWNLNGTFCERTLTHNPICDSGFTYNSLSDQCESVNPTDYNYSCDAGWTLDGTSCYRYIYNVPSCDADYIFENDVCAPYVEKPQIPSCPSDFVIETSTCKKQTLEPAKCVVGYQLSPQADECSQATVDVIGFQCPAGWTLVGTQCEMNTSLGNQLVCGVGYSFDALTSECSKTDYAYPTYICPAGYDRMEDERTCRKIVDDTTAPTGMSCPYEGFELQVNECVLTFNLQMNSYCEDQTRELVPTPTGIIFDPAITTDYACMKIIRKFEDANFECPDDYTKFANSFCSIPTETDLLYTCLNPELAPDFDSNTCVGTVLVTEPKIAYCPTGDQVGGQCNTYYYASPSIECTYAMETLINGVCIQNVVVDITSAFLECDDSGMTPDGSVCTKVSLSYPIYTCSSAEYVVNETLGVCVKDVLSTQVPTTSCPIGGMKVGEECVITDTEQADYGCPTTAWTLDGSTCSREFTQTKTATVCATGDVLVGNYCYSVTNHAFVEGCLDAQTFNSTSGMCEYRDKVYGDPVTVCDDSGYSPYGLVCRLVTSAPAIKTCSDASYTNIGDYCYEEVITGSTPTYGCFDPYLDSGSDCIVNDVVSVDITCPSQYVYNSGFDRCDAVNLDKRSATYNCPSDYVKLDDFKCEKLIAVLPPVFTCEEEDGQLNGDQCVKKQEVEQAQGYCAPPYQLSGSVCMQKFTQGYTTTCPATSEQSGNQCFTHAITTEVPVQVCD